jgi:hypothetical protein
MGAVFRAFSKAGEIVRAGMVPTSSPRAHARWVSTWVAAPRNYAGNTGKGRSYGLTSGASS